MNYSPSYFLRIVISFMACSFAQTALGSTRLCSDLFPAVLGSASNPKSTVSADFLQASHNYFAATLTQASKSTSASEMKVYFSKLSAIAKEHQLSQSEFQNWIDLAKMSFVREYFLEAKPDSPFLILDRNKLTKLDAADIQMKLSSMPEFLSSHQFLDLMADQRTDSEGTSKSTLQQHNSNRYSKQHFINVIRHLPEFQKMGDADDFNPISGVIVYSLPTQNPKLLNVVYDYDTTNDSREYLWSLQRKVDFPYSTPFPVLKSIAHIPIQISDPRHMNSIFPFYNPETNTISIAIFFKSNSSLKVRWISSIPSQDIEVAMELPHLSTEDETYLSTNLPKLLDKYPSSSYVIFYLEKAKAFSFSTNLPWTEESNGLILKVLILANAYMVTKNSDREFIIHDNIQISPWLSDPLLHYFLADDGHFLKLEVIGRIKEELLQNPNVKIPPSNTEGLTLHTRYYLLDLQNEFQLRSMKKAKE